MSWFVQSEIDPVCHYELAGVKYNLTIFALSLQPGEVQEFQNSLHKGCQKKLFMLISCICWGMEYFNTYHSPGLRHFPPRTETRTFLNSRINLHGGITVFWNHLRVAKLGHRIFWKRSRQFFKISVLFGQCLKISLDMKVLGSDLVFFREILIHTSHESVLNDRLLWGFVFIQFFLLI